MLSPRYGLRASSAAGIVCVFLAACGGGSSGTSTGVPVVGAVATPTTPAILPGTQPTVAPTSPASTSNAAAFVCPSSAGLAQSASGMRRIGNAVRRAPRRAASPTITAGATQLLAVTYDETAATAQKTTLAMRESTLGATRMREYAFSHAHLVTHVLAVPAGGVARIEAKLRHTAGVRSVGLTGARRFASSVTTPYYPSDPYFTGFATTAAPSGGATAPPATFESGLAASADVPGQWDMHAIRLEQAFAYGRAGNGSGVVNAGALGSPAVKLAIIDTGEDATHPELQSKIVYQRCFLTNAAGTQSTSAFADDPDGHGTDVAGIAGAATGNSLGFAGAGGNVALYGYRVFPTPDDACATPGSADSQCGTDTRDIASAIQDAVVNHVNVISLSLGGSGCDASGADPDPLEGSAVADAIAAGIVVVAAAGNGSGPPVEAPACDPGVIAVGATSLSDGTPNASGATNGSAAAPAEYVAAYTDYGQPGAAPGSATAWGIVAPGGDPTNGNDTDDLHWIENIWTSTPYAASSTDTAFAGNCSGDYPSESGTADCRVLIAGTSMSTPHVAGAAALIVSANPGYQSPARMKQLLCATADDIGDAHEGCGRLDVYRAMAAAVGDPAPPAALAIP